MNELRERIRAVIQSRGLFQRGQTILIAVSGGLDSMVLLHVLHELARVEKWRLCVAHLNHCLRGKSSDADASLVRGACKRLAVPSVVQRVDVRKLARVQKLSIEMAARKARHEFLARTAAKRKISTIALAHHEDDQVELFFIRLLRGSGGEGLAGMKWRACSPVAKKIDIARPLLGESKSALRDYANQNKIRFREDATNDSLDMMRNRLRHELLPLLRRNYQPALSRVVLRVMEIVGEEAELARQMAEDWPGQMESSKSTRRACCFDDLPSAVQRRAIQLQLSEKAVSHDFELIEKLRLRPDVPISIPEPRLGTRQLLRDRAGFLHWHTPESIQFDIESRQISLSQPTGNAAFGGVMFAWKWQTSEGMALPKKKAQTEYFDGQLIGSKVVMRHWRKGDRFQPIGMLSAIKLQDLFVNHKVPRAFRHRLIVAENANGDIFWVEGLRISERFQLTKATKLRLQWRWRRV